MGESDRYIEYKNLAPKNRFSLGNEHNALMTLVTLNAIFFLLLLTLQVTYFFYQQSAESYNNAVVQWFELPSTFSTFIERPWTLFSFMFSDTSQGLWRLLSNMFWLWTFGYLLQELSGNDKIIPIYIYGGVLGGLFFLGAHTFIFVNSPTSILIGANPSILAIAGATTFLSPKHRILTHIRKGIPVWILFVIYLAINFLGFHSLYSETALAHFGGLLAGIIFIALLKKGKNPGAWMNSFYFQLINLFTPKKKNDDNSLKNKKYYPAGNSALYNKADNNNQQKIDALLDKINALGFDSLSVEEKIFLQNSSNEEK